MSHSIADIAAAIGARFEGDGAIRVIAASEPAAATADQLALAMDPKYAPGIAQGAARAAVLWEGADWQGLGLKAAILVSRPRLAMSGLSRVFDPGPGLAPGIHPLAVIDPSAQVGEGASLGAFVVIGPGARIGARARIADQVSIGADVVIGDDALILSGVRIGARVRIGHRFIAQPGCVIGGDGFSFVTETASRAEEARATLGKAAEAPAEAQPWLRIHSLGAVTIGDDVEVGANSSIDRGTVRDTRIGRGTKIDSLVQVGHNVVIGEDCLLCAQSGVAGSTRVGNRVVLGGHVGVSDNLTIGDDVVAGGAAKLLTSVAAGKMMMGPPSVRMDQQIELYKAQRKLPRLLAQVAELQKLVTDLMHKGPGKAP